MYFNILDVFIFDLKSEGVVQRFILLAGEPVNNQASLRESLSVLRWWGLGCVSLHENRGELSSHSCRLAQHKHGY